MTIFELPIGDLANDPANVRRHPEEQIIRLMGMLRRFGQQLPLIIDGNSVVRVGNARLEAMRRLNWERVQVVRSDLAGSDLVAFAVSDNRAPDGSSFDAEALAATLTALKAEDYDITAVGYTLDEYAALLPKPADQPNAPAQFPGFDENIPTQHECPKCRFRWSGSTAPQEAA